MHLNSQLIFRRFAAPLFKDGQRVLEIGPDSNPSTYRSEVGIWTCTGRRLTWRAK